MTYVVGIIGLGVLFALFTALRPSDGGCTGQCAGCTGDGSCASKETTVPNEDVRRLE